jgi:hypothetical protein
MEVISTATGQTNASAGGPLLSFTAQTTVP